MKAFLRSTASVFVCVCVIQEILLHVGARCISAGCRDSITQMIYMIPKLAESTDIYQFPKYNTICIRYEVCLNPRGQCGVYLDLYIVYVLVRHCKIRKYVFAVILYCLHIVLSH